MKKLKFIKQIKNPRKVFQLKSMEVLNLQIVKGTEKVKSVIMLGDVNLCSQKWNDKNFAYKKLAVSLKNTLLECGLHQRDMGLTFTSDIIQANGNIASSAIDHIYLSEEIYTTVLYMQRYYTLSCRYPRLF